MRRITVPIDMASEQKEILGVLSKRQLIYIGVGGALLYAYIPVVFQLFPNFIVGFFATLISAVPTVVVVVMLGFVRKHKLRLNFDHYLFIKWGYKKQIGIWRKGKYPKKWMVSDE